MMPRKTQCTSLGAALFAAFSINVTSAHAISLQVHGDGGLVGDYASDLPPNDARIQGFRVPIRFSLEARVTNTLSLFGDVRFNFDNYPSLSRGLGNADNTVSSAPNYGDGILHPMAWFSKGAKLDTLTTGVAYIQWAADFGLIRAGRMPHHWGLGLWRNSEWSAAGGVLSTSDAIAYTTDFSSTFNVTLAWEKISEGSLASKDDDADAYTAEAMIMDDPADVSSGGLSRQVGLSFQRYEHKQSSTKLLSMDLFTRLALGDLAAEGEVFFPNGSTSSPSYAWLGGQDTCADVTLNPKKDYLTCASQKVSSFATLWKLRYQLVGAGAISQKDVMKMRDVPTNLRGESQTLGLLFGYARGDSDGFDNVTKDNDLHTVAMHPNIRPALMMYNLHMKNIAGMPGPYVRNTLFVRADYTYESPSFGAVTPALIWGSLASKNTSTDVNAYGRNSNLGMELDLGYRFQTADNLQLGADTGIWLPGDAWKTDSYRPANVFGLRVTAETHF